MPKISVIVPVYKVEPYLRRCVDSILAQTFEDFELILVDDGSPDGCPAICDEYAKKDDRVRVIHKENGGLSDARNAGLDVANGEFISFIDSDDWVSDCYFEYLYRAVREENADISLCSFQKCSEIILENTNFQYAVSEFLNGISYQYKLLSGVGSERYVVVWNKLYRRRLLNELRFPVGKIHEDVFFTYFAAYRAQKIVEITPECYYYFQRSSSIMGSGYTIHTLDAFEGELIRQNFYKNLGLKELAKVHSDATEYGLVNFRDKHSENNMETLKKVD